ncbi:MAG TPA: MFS transporter, partial [Nitrososphaerales archaeon]|nr:MFS transporter [Nitrososphaerales archaeon]
FFFFFENRKANPLMHLGLLRIRNVLVANLIGLVSGVIMFSLFFAVVYYTQLPPGFGLFQTITSSGLTLAPSTLAMLLGGLIFGRVIPRIGPKPVLLMGSGFMGVGLLLFILQRSTTWYVAGDLSVTLFGVIAIIVPIVNMLGIALPRENVAVGFGMNTLLRNLGGAIGPVVATAIMTTYTAPFREGPVVANLPTATAFNIIFGVGIVLAVLVIGISLATKNYKFENQAAQSVT